MPRSSCSCSRCRDRLALPRAAPGVPGPRSATRCRSTSCRGTSRRRLLWFVRRLGRRRACCSALRALGAHRAADGRAPARARCRRCSAYLADRRLDRRRPAGLRCATRSTGAPRAKPSTSPRCSLAVAAACAHQRRRGGGARRSSWRRSSRPARCSTSCTRSCRAMTTGSCARSRPTRSGRSRAPPASLAADRAARSPPAGLAAGGAAPGRSRRRSRRSSTALHVLHGLNHGTLASAVVLLALVARRHDFDGPGDPATRRLVLRAAWRSPSRDCSSTASRRSG